MLTPPIDELWWPNQGKRSKDRARAAASNNIIYYFRYNGLVPLFTFSCNHHQHHHHCHNPFGRLAFLFLPPSALLLHMMIGGCVNFNLPLELCPRGDIITLGLAIECHRAALIEGIERLLLLLIIGTTMHKATHQRLLVSAVKLVRKGSPVDRYNNI